MIEYPKYVIIKNERYKINTDFRIALKCEEVGKNETSEQERALAIIYLLFGDKGLKDSHNWEELLKMALLYLKCGKEVDNVNNVDDEECSMDFRQDWEYIMASFFYDYKIRITRNFKMHWWEFYNLLCGLSDKCILNRVRFIREFDISQIKDSKERAKWIKQKKQVALKKEAIKTPEQKRLDKLFIKQLTGGSNCGKNRRILEN